MTEGEGMLLQFFFRDGKFILGPVDKAFLGIPSYLERVADGIKGSHGNHGKVGENPKARAAHDGKLRNGLGRSYGEGVHKGTCIADGCGTGNDGKANDGVISHGNGDARILPRTTRRSLATSPSKAPEPMMRPMKP